MFIDLHNFRDIQRHKPPGEKSDYYVSHYKEVGENLDVYLLNDVEIKRLREIKDNEELLKLIIKASLIQDKFVVADKVLDTSSLNDTPIEFYKVKVLDDFIVKLQKSVGVENQESMFKKYTELLKDYDLLKNDDKIFYDKNKVMKLEEVVREENKERVKIAFPHPYTMYLKLLDEYSYTPVNFNKLESFLVISKTDFNFYKKINEKTLSKINECHYLIKEKFIDRLNKIEERFENLDKYLTKYKNRMLYEAGEKLYNEMVRDVKKNLNMVKEDKESVGISMLKKIIEKEKEEYSVDINEKIKNEDINKEMLRRTPKTLTHYMGKF